MPDKPKPCAECGAKPHIDRCMATGSSRAIYAVSASCVDLIGERCGTSSMDETVAIAQWNKMQGDTNV